MRTFELRKGALRVSRLGPANAQRQTHREGNVAPVNRGVWAFPFGHDDPFFYFHQWKKALPKRLKDKAMMAASREELAILSKEQDEKMREIRSRLKLTHWWHSGPLYSRIAPPHSGSADWYLWESPTEWVKAARKQIWTWTRWNADGPLVKSEYSKDHFELFLPMTAAKLPHMTHRRPESKTRKQTLIDPWN